MNFDFSDDQKMVKNEARKFLKKECGTQAARRILDGEAPYDEKLWKAIAEMGWTGTTIPESYGGVGLGYLELCVIAEELGRSIAPVPFSSSICLAAEALLQFGSEAQKEKYLPKIASGEWIGTLAQPGTPGLVLTSGKLQGAALPVPDGDVAHFAVVAAQMGNDLALAIADLTGRGVKREAVKTVDPSRSHAKIEFHDAPAELLGQPGKGKLHLTRLIDRAAILAAMEQLGGADAALAAAQEYARGRFAFGRPIGSFQAIKHKLADVYVKIELARSNDYYGAWALSHDAPELPLAACAARISSTEAFNFASQENIQVHGGNGFTWEYDCHLYYRRAKLLSLSLGSVRAWKDRLIACVEEQKAA